MKQYDHLVKWNDRLHFSSTKPTLHIASVYIHLVLHTDLIHKVG